MLFIAARWRRRCALLPLIWIPLLWCACSPDLFQSPDEDRDRNFQKARDATRLGDYQGAAEYYRRAVESNPRSASVHLGYASLCEGPLQQYADAVYHYQQYLRLRPDDPKADDIRRRVTNCTERLATSVPLVVRSETIARDLEAVRRENQSLRVQITNLLGHVHYWSNAVQRLAQVGDLGPLGDAPRDGLPYDDDPPRSPSDRGGRSPSLDRDGSRSPPASARSHRVQSGDTLHRISRQYGVSLDALRRANPRINERRLLPGTYVRIPGR